MPDRSLGDLHILDFSRVLAGPLATMVLADLGATVTKVERPGTGDETRSWGPPYDATGTATYFQSVNRNKRSVVIDLGDPDGRRRARELAADSDVIVENFRPGVMERMGLGYEHLAASDPAIVYCSITGFGAAGGAALPGYDLLVQALGGLMSITGDPGGEPQKVGVALVDVIAGLFASVGILAALRHRDRTGEGQRVEVDLLSALLAGLVNQAQAYTGAGVVAQRMGNEHPSIAPYEVFGAADADLVLAVGNDRQFGDLCAIAGVPGVAADPRFAAQRQPGRAPCRAAGGAVGRAGPAPRGRVDRPPERGGCAGGQGQRHRPGVRAGGVARARPDRRDPARRRRAVPHGAQPDPPVAHARPLRERAAGPGGALTRTRDPLPDSAEVVVIGGGVIGASAAFHLAEAGVDVVLLERDELAGGSTRRAAGGVRAQFSDALNIQIARRSLELFRDFGRRPGWEIDLHQVGYLFLLTEDDDVAKFEQSVALQNEHGVPSRMVTPAEARDLCPVVETGDVLAGAFSPEDGTATPEAVVHGYAHGARAHGAHVETRCEVTSIAVEDGAVTAVGTSKGTIAAGTVVCAAGAWSRGCAALAGVALPVIPVRRQIMFTEAIPGLPARLPMTIDFATSFYFHREGPGVLMGMADPDETPGFKLETSDDWVPALQAAAERRAPRIAAAGIRGGWAGLYEVTPDHNAVIGEASGVSGFLYATGFSGHGFLQGPAVGEIVRDLVLGREPFADVAPLSVDRFDAQALRPEFNVV